MTRWKKPEDPIAIVKKLQRQYGKVAAGGGPNVQRTDPDNKPPIPPTVALTFKAREHKTRLEYRAIVTWDLISPNTCQGDVDRWIVQIRATDSGGTPIDAETAGGATRNIRQEQRVDNKGETDVHAIFNQIPKPKKWYWQARVAIRDRDHQLGDFSAWTTAQLPFTEALPKPPVPTGIDIIFDTLEKTRWDRLRAIVEWNEVTNWDVPGGDIESDMAGYQVAFRQTDSGGTAIGTKVRKRRVEAKDADADTLQHVVFDNHIKKQSYYQARVRSIDRWNRRGDWSAWTTTEQALTDTSAPPSPTNVTGYIDQHRIVVEWDLPNEAGDAATISEDIAFAQVQVATDSGYTNIIKDRRVSGEEKMFKVRKPQTTYYVRVRTHDSSWNKSAWVSTSASKVTPNAPSVAITFDAGGPKKSRYRVISTVTPGTTDIDDDVSFYRVQFVHKATNVSPTASDRRKVQIVDPDDDLKATFGNVRKSHYTWSRVRATDHQGRIGNWSAWTAGGLPTASPTVSAPTGVAVVKGPRRLQIEWNSFADDDDEVDGYKVEIRQGGTLKKTRYLGGKANSYRYMIPAADRGLNHEGRVFARDDMGNESTSGTANATDDEKLDETDLIDAFSQSSGKTYTFNGSIVLAGASGGFQTSASAPFIELARVSGADKIRFVPATGSPTVLEVGTDGIRWGGSSSSILSRLRQDSTLQLGETAAPAGLATTAAVLFARLDTVPTRTSLVVKFGRSGKAKVIMDSL